MLTVLFTQLLHGVLNLSLPVLSCVTIIQFIAHSVPENVNAQTGAKAQIFKKIFDRLIYLKKGKPFADLNVKHSQG